MPSFHEVLFPEDISYGSTGGPGFNTTVIELTSGVEQRNINWSEAKAKYEVSMGVKTREQMEDLLDFFYARNGKAYGFRYKDWADFDILHGKVGLGTGTGSSQQFQIIKQYEVGTDYTYDRPIRKIVPDTFSYRVNGAENPYSFTLDVNTGLFTINNQVALNAIVDVTCEFHVPVRFDTDEMNISQDDWETMSWPSIPIVELKLR